jgi:putative aminopeptidase
VSEGAVSGDARKRRTSRGAAFALIAALVAGCAPVLELLTPRAPKEWATLVDDIRAFERRIGFAPTNNFVSFTEERGGFPFCGHASRFSLPYSYEDPAIQWRDSLTAEECRAQAGGADVYFGILEALGEVGTPVTPEMAASKIDRFLYLVIHEDCHDQFDLPTGIEEALCNLVAYKAMAAFSAERLASSARANWAVHRYASLESQRTRATIVHYEQLATVYARYERREMSHDALMRERARILRAAARDLAWKRGPLTNVGLASDMTYSRHYPFLESVFEALGGNLAKTVAFFKHVDRLKPSRAAIMEQQGIASEESVDFLRAYETAVIETARKALAETQRHP